MAKISKLWLLRKDNVRQRYSTTRATLKKRGYKYDHKKRAWRKPTVTPPPPPPPPEGPLIRQTIAINYVNKNTYFSIVLQAWDRSEDKLRALEANHKEELVRALEQHLGFKRDSWWFVHQFGIGYQGVPYAKFLDGRKEIRNERRGG